MLADQFMVKTAEMFSFIHGSKHETYLRHHVTVIVTVMQ